MSTLTLKRADVSHILPIQTLAEKIWRVHYPEIIGEEQVNYMLRKMYNEKSLQTQMQESGHIFYLIQSAEKNIGFVSVSSDDHKNWMLHKFYILSEEQKTGTGTKAFQQLVNELNFPQSIRLTVNRQNYKSINFYFKNGFIIEKVADFDIGDGYFMNDFVMLRKF